MRFEGLAKNHRVVINGRTHPEDKPVGQRRGMVKPALWRQRCLGSSSSYHGVYERHSREEARVTQGDLALSERKIWLRYCDIHRRKDVKKGKQTST